MLDIHLICHDSHMLDDKGDGLFETGNWRGISPEDCDAAIGGRVYLHRTRFEVAYHGGTIMKWWVPEGVEEKRKRFLFRADAPLVACPIAHWREGLPVGINRREIEQ